MENKEKIYTVYVIEYQGTVMYVGKTIDFTNRKWKHLHGYGRIPTNINTNDVDIKPIESFKTKEEALEYEDELICRYDTINTGWNKNRSGLIYSRDIKGYNRKRKQTDEAKEKSKQYNKEHRDKFREYSKKYYQNHKEQVLNYKKQYYQTPKGHTKPWN